MFKQSILESVQVIFMFICECFEAAPLTVEGERDHVHFLVQYPSKLVIALKSVSWRVLRRQFKQDIEKYYWKDILWSPNYFSGSDDTAIDTVRKYHKK